jgi:hypothetical protein
MEISKVYFRGRFFMSRIKHSPELKRKILTVILREIDSLRLRRNALARVVAKFPTLTDIAGKAAFDAQNLLIVQKCTVRAIFTGFFNFLSEQHSKYLS